MTVKKGWVVSCTECLLQWTDEIHREYALSFLTSEYRDLVLYRLGMKLTLVLKSVNTAVVICYPMVTTFRTPNRLESASLLSLDEDAGDDSPLELPSVSMATFPAIVSMMYNAQPSQFVPLVTTLIQNVCICPTHQY